MARVLVIGSGLAGLSAAETLRRAGAIVLVLEAGRRCGGRVWTAPDGERGAQYISDDARELRRLVKDLGLKMRPAASKGRVWWQGRWEQVRPGLGLKRVRLGRARDTQSLADIWPDERLNLFWRDEYAVDADRTSALFASWQLPYLLGGLGGESTVVGGMSRITEALCAKLDVRLGTRVRSVERGAVAWDGGRERADAVIVATPHFATREIEFTPALPAGLARAIASQNYGDYVRVLLKFRERFWEDDLFYMPTGSVCGEGTVLNVLLSGRACTRDAMAEVAKIWPEAPGLLVEALVTDWRGRAVPYWGPGDVTGWSDHLNDRAGKIFFAGDWFELEPGMEAAVRSGRRAARGALKLL